jgi:TolB-like protein
LPSIAVDDIGGCALAPFQRGADAIGHALGIAAEHLTGAELAQTITDVIGRKVTYTPISAEACRSLGFVRAEYQSEQGPPPEISSDASAPQSQPPRPIFGPKIVQRPFGVALLILGIGVFSAIAVAVFVREHRQTPNSATVVAMATRTVAVLPFENLSATHESDYIAVGLSEMVLNRVSAVPSLQVVARTSSSFALRGVDLEVRDIGHKLNAYYLVQGSVQRSGDPLAPLNPVYLLLEHQTRQHVGSDSQQSQVPGMDVRPTDTDLPTARASRRNVA